MFQILENSRISVMIQDTVVSMFELVSFHTPVSILVKWCNKAGYTRTLSGSRGKCRRFVPECSVVAAFKQPFIVGHVSKIGHHFMGMFFENIDCGRVPSQSEKL